MAEYSSRIPRKQRGFSLSEVLIATFVASIGILGVCSSFYYAIRAESEANRRTVATFYAREMINLIRSRNLPFIAATVPPTAPDPINDGNYDNPSDDNQAYASRRDFNAAPFANDFPNSNNFKRRIEMKRVSTNASDPRYNLVAVKLTVYWIQHGKEKSVTMWSYHRQP